MNRLRTVIANPLRYDGRNPAEELHRIGFDEKVEQAERTRALAAAAPYYTPKAPQYIRKPIEIPLINTVGDALATIAQLTTLAGAKELALDEAKLLIGYIESLGQVLPDQQPRIARGPYTSRAARRAGAAAAGGATVAR